jgi:HAMP domain-containing protein
MSKESEKATARSPLAGCLILIVALLVMVSLIVFSTWTLFRQFDEIVKFTQEKQEPVPVVVLEGREDEINGLAEKVEVFRQRLSEAEAAEMALSVDEINLAIALWEPLGELRGTFHVLKAEEGRLHIAISFPLNGKPRLARAGEQGWMVSDPRYLQATMIAQPAMSQREIVLRIEDLVVPGAEVPREFIEQMSPYRITERYLADPELGPLMGKLSRVEVRDGALWLVRVPGQVAEGTIADEKVDDARGKLFTVLGAAAGLFLVVAGTIVFFGLRARAGGRREG